MRLTLQLVILIVLGAVIKTADSKMTMDQLRNALKPFKNTCLKKTSADVDLVEATKSGQFPQDPSLMCFLKCVLTMMKVMTKSGEVSLASITQQIDLMMPDEYVDIVKDICTQCSEEAATLQEPCERAHRFVSCYYEKNAELYFFP